MKRKKEKREREEKNWDEKGKGRIWDGKRRKGRGR